MIQESYEWKQAIKRNDAYVRRLCNSALSDEEEYLLDRIQIRLVSNALFVRRLLETPKVATALKHAAIPVVTFPWKGTRVDYFNNHHIDSKYQLNNGLDKTVRAAILCDQIIHSFVWAWLTDDTGGHLDGFMVSSDRKKHSELIAVQLHDWLGFTRAVANSDPTCGLYIRDDAKGEWEFHAK